MSKPTNQELMKAVADVLDEALAEYEKLSKAELGIDGAETLSLEAHAKPVSEPGIGGPGQKPMMAKEEAPAEPMMDKEKEKEDEEEEDDEKLMQSYKSLVAKMEKRGLMHHKKKEEHKMHKSEATEERFESLAKAIKEVSETVKKIAAAPAAPRKGLAGYAPLRKSEEGEGKSLRKSEVVNKLIELKKSGTAGIDTGLINRVETSRLTPSDVEAIKSLGILG